MLFTSAAKRSGKAGVLCIGFDLAVEFDSGWGSSPRLFAGAFFVVLDLAQE